MTELRCLPMLASLLAVTAISAQSKAPTKGLYDNYTLRTLHLTFQQKDWWAQLLANKVTETYIAADLLVDGKLYQKIGVRFRGGSSYTLPLVQKLKKMPFKLKLDAFVPGQELLGHSSLDLNNGFWDPSWMREVCGMRMMREFMPAPRANFVKLVINKENWGIYINMEVPNKDFLKSWFTSNDGNRYKGFTNFGYRGTNPTSYHKNLPLVSPPRPDSYKDLINALSKTTIPDRNAAAAAMAKAIDVDLGHRLMAANSLLRNADAFPGHNFYIYFDPLHGDLSLIPWDINAGFQRVNWITNPSRPGKFAQTDLWVRRYQGHFRNLLDRHLGGQVLTGWVLRYHKLIDAEVKADNKSLYSYKNFQANLGWGSVSVLPTFVDGLAAAVSSWTTLPARYPFLKRPRVALSAPTHSPTMPTSNQATLIRVSTVGNTAAKSVTLHWRSKGYFREVPMADDGKNGDNKAGDGIFAATVPAQPAGATIDYYFSAESQVGDISFLPTATTTRPLKAQVQAKPSSVLIHEFVARNSKGLKDANGERDDWIELFNSSKNPVALDGLYLTDERGVPTKWKFPVGSTIAGKSTMLLWADDQPSQGKLHTNFKLSGDGEQILLIDKDGRSVLDAVTFGPQDKDISTGRLLDRRSPFVTFAQPSPQRGNEIPAGCGHRLFGALDPASQTMSLSLSGPARLGSKVTLQVSGAQKNGRCLILAALTPDNRPLPGTQISLMIGPSLISIATVPTDSAGTARQLLQVPSLTAWQGLQLTLQAASGNASSSGLELRICK